MVDYNTEGTIATPAVDINRIQILERRAYVIEALEKYMKYRISGSSPDPREFITRLISLFWELQETLYRKYKNDKEMTYEAMFKLLNSKKVPIEEALIIWSKINILLGEIKLTRIDTKPSYDSTDIEEENNVQSL